MAEDDMVPSATSDMSDPIEPDAAQSTPQEMTTIDIAKTAGDVILVLQETCLCVSSIILSSASPVFKTMLGPNFLEGQGDRSAQDPKEISLPDDDDAVMLRLCRMLHHQRDLTEISNDPRLLAKHAMDLFDLAVLADKYGCIESIQMAGGYLLSDLGSRTRPKDTTIPVLLHLTAVAYIIQDRRHFALFTRRLVMDHTDPYSRFCHHSAHTMLPNLCLLAVEEQRKAAWSLLHDELPKLATRECNYSVSCGCIIKRTDYKFPATLAGRLPSYRAESPVFWPPSDRALRYILSETYNCGGNVRCDVPVTCGHGNPPNWEVSCEKIKNLCDRVNKAALGLCLECLPSLLPTPVNCPHQLLELWVESDPFV